MVLLKYCTYFVKNISYIGDQQNARVFFNNLFQLNYPRHVSTKLLFIIRRSEQAACSTLPCILQGGSIGSCQRLRLLIRCMVKYRNNKNKCHTSVDNTTFILYTMVYMSGRHVSTQSVIIRPSKKADPRFIQFFCIVGSKMLTSFSCRSKSTYACIS